MKKFGKRTLSMLLAFGLTASMLLSDLSVMQVNAAGGVTPTVEGESSTVEMVTEELTTEDSVVEETTSTEVASWEETEENVSVLEEVTETEETTSEEVETVPEDATVEEATVAETSEETTVEVETVEEITEEESVTEQAEDVGADAAFTLWVDADGVLSVSCNEIGVTKISGSVTIPAAAKVIPADAALFKGNTLVTKVTFEEGSLLERIEDEAFFTTSSLTEIKIPAGVSYIGEKAFHASGLKKLTLEDGENAASVTLGYSAFQVNTALTTVVTNGRLGVIGESAFAGDSALKTFVGISASDPVDEGALAGTTAIGARAFSGCSSLEYITIPDTVTAIEEGTFENCTSFGKNTDYFAGVKSVKLGNGVTRINTSAFAGCTALTEITVPASVNYIGVNAFSGCNALKKITIKNQDGDNKSCAVKLTDTSFPYIKGLTLEAYDGTVKDWVGLHSTYGLKFASLYENYAISYAEMKFGTVKANVTKAKVGATVTLTVTPDEGYTLKYSKLWYTYTDNFGNEQSGPVDPWKYTFEMPEYPVKIHAIFVKIADLKYGEALTLTEDGLINPLNKGLITYDADENVLDMGKPWQTVRIQASGSNGEIPGSSELKFSSANSKIATVDAYGNVRSVAPGETTITVALKDETKGTKPLELAVKVGNKTTVSGLSLKYTASMGTIQYASDEGSEAAEVGYDIITYPASALKLGAKNITITFNGVDESGDKLDVVYQLSSNDTSIAKPVSTKVTGSGKVNIPKNTTGETFVTVKAVDGSTDPVKVQFIVRVVDDTPRLAKSTINVDPQSDKGALLELVSVYGNTSDVTKYKIVTKKVSNGITSWPEATDMFYLSVEGDQIYLKAKVKDEYKDGKTRTFKNTYYISGELKDSGTRFYVVIPTVNISMKELDLPLKTSGKINLFYNGLADVAKSGSVTLVPKDKKATLKIADCELIGKKKSNGVNTDDDELFEENFTAQLDYEKQKITITRNPESEILARYSAGNEKVKGKAVVSGILKIYYEGYSDDFADEIAIKVPTHTTVPSYSAKLTTLTEGVSGNTLKKITLNENASGQQYAISFVNKKTKKIEDITEDTVIEVDYQDGATPYGLIVDEGDDGVLEADTEQDIVSIQIAYAQKGKIVLILRQPDWEYSETRFVKVSLPVSVTKNTPSVKLGKKTLTLNAECPAAGDYTSMTLNQADSELLTDQHFEPATEKEAEKEGIDNIHIYYDSEKQTVNAQLTGEVKKGTYQFKCTPEFVYSGGTEGEAKTFKINVKVNKQTPSIKLKSATFQVNAASYKNGENKYDFMERTFSWVNLPAEYSGYELSMENMELEYAGKGKDPFAPAEEETCVQFTIDAVEKKAKVWMEADRAGSAVYTVKGLELVGDEGTVAVKPFKITVKSVAKNPSISLKAKGTINPLNPESQILYTTTLKNIGGTVEEVMLKELARSGAPVAEGEEHFTADIDPETGKTVLKVKVDPETGKTVQLENRTYKIKMYYKLTNGEKVQNDGWYFAKDVKVTPKQTMPKLTIDKKSATFFAGDKSRTQTITVTQKKTTAEIIDIKFSNKVSKSLQNAFIINYDAETGKMELQLKNSAFIKQNVSQTLTFEIVCEGQLANTKGRTFTVKVKVIK